MSVADPEALDRAFLGKDFLNSDLISVYRGICAIVDSVCEVDMELTVVLLILSSETAALIIGLSNKLDRGLIDRVVSVLVSG